MTSRITIAASVIVLLAACGGDSKNATGPDSECNRGSLTIGAIRTGTLASSDCAFSATSGASGRYDSYSVTLAAGEVYQVIDADESGSIDPYVEVVAPGGSLAAFGDDDALGYNTELFFVAPTSGTYRIRAGNYDESVFGDYRLLIRSCGATRITSTAAISGVLTASDPCVTAYTEPGTIGISAADVFVFTSTNTSRTLTVTSTAFTPFFAVGGPAFFPEGAFIDVSNVGSPATLTLPSNLPAGSYIVVVTADSEFAGGAYTIQSSVASSSARFAPPPAALTAWRKSTKGK